MTSDVQNTALIVRQKTSCYMHSSQTSFYSVPVVATAAGLHLLVVGSSREPGVELLLPVCMGLVVGHVCRIAGNDIVEELGPKENIINLCNQPAAHHFVVCLRLTGLDVLGE